MNNERQPFGATAPETEGEKPQVTSEEIVQTLQEMTPEEKLDLANKTIAELNAKVEELEGKLVGSPGAVSLGRFNLRKMAENAKVLILTCLEKATDPSAGFGLMVSGGSVAVTTLALFGSPMGEKPLIPGYELSGGLVAPLVSASAFLIGIIQPMFEDLHEKIKEKLVLAKGGKV